MARSASVDPLEKFRFTLSWSDSLGSEATKTTKVGFHDVQMPKRSTNKIEYREGSDPDINQISPGLSSMEDIVLSRGLVIDDADEGKNEFYQWMSSVHKPTSGHGPRGVATGVTSNGASNTYKKDVTISMYDREGSVARKWVVYNAFPINFVPGSDLDASEDGEKSLEQLTLAYEDFQEMKLEGASEKDVSDSFPSA